MNPTCTTDSLIETYPFFAALNPRQQLALKVFYAAKELATLGGTNYTAALTSVAAGGLIKAANDLFEKAHQGQLDTAELTIYRNNATAAGASLNSDIQDLMEDIATLDNVDDVMLEKMRLTLLCKLGVHKAYPQ